MINVNIPLFSFLLILSFSLSLSNYTLTHPPLKAQQSRREIRERGWKIRHHQQVQFHEQYGKQYGWSCSTDKRKVNTDSNDGLKNQC